MTFSSPSCPYPGLRRFDEANSHLFFGREREAATVVERLVASRFLAITGESGCGKSSLILSGVSRLLKSSGATWRFLVIQPGSDPIANFASALAGLVDQPTDLDPEIAECTLRSSSRGVREALRHARIPLDDRVLIVVDQFEEIFRFKQTHHCAAEDARAFVRLLLTAAADDGSNTYVVITMRSDYLGECAQFASLPEAINEGEYLVPRMTREQMRSAIQRPAIAVDAEIAPRLVARILNEVSDDPGELPVLQHALMRTWEAWSADHEPDEPIDFRHYETSGTIVDALSRHADETFDNLESAKLRATAERMFKALTETPPGGRPVRRPIPFGALPAITGANLDEIEQIVTHFAAPGRRFLRYPGEPGPPASDFANIDITHESLIPRWQRLQEWVQSEARNAELFRRLARDAQLQAAGERNLFWRDPELQLAIDWRDQDNPNESWASLYRLDFRSSMDFLKASEDLCEAEKRGIPAELARCLKSLGYAIEERIAQSELGIVYRAKRLADSRHVALKTPASSTHETDRESLGREAEVMERLDHAGIVSILGVHAELNPPFFIMEWVDGKPINQALEGADWHAKAEVVESVCDSIEYAHRQGIVHGDLKPTNILIRSDRKSKILDFGLSRLLDDQANPSRRSSMSAAGTALYMAPEQIRGEQPGPGADVYALGTILYELLTGAPPFTGENLHDVRNAQLHQAPDLPMLREEAVPEPLQRICLKALEKKESDRYVSVREMKEDLKRYRLGKAVLVRPSYYNNLIESPAKDHVDQIEEWYKKSLITESEYVRLRRAYETLTRSGLKAVSESRLVHPSVLALYVGSWLFLAGAAIWLTFQYQELKKPSMDQGASLARAILGMLPVLLTNGLWLFFMRKGSYRFAFAAMVVGLLSLPFATGVAVYELAKVFGGFEHLRVLMELVNPGQHLPRNWPIPEIVIALLAALVWDTYVAFRSRTLTSATIAGVHFVLLYVAVLDVIGLKYLFFEKPGYGGIFMLLAAGLLGLAGVVVARRPEPSGQSRPLFAIAIVVAIVASQTIALGAPSTWVGWAELDTQHALMAIFQIPLGIIYLFSSIYLRNRFRVEGATAYLVLARLAPLTFLTGIGILDWTWPPGDLIKNVTPWAPVLLIASVGIVFMAARLQSLFYSVAGLGTLAYAVSRIAYEIEVKDWRWPVAVMVVGLVITAWLTWWDLRKRVGQEDIDDVGEELIKQSRKRSSSPESGAELKTVVDM